jgi:hypothetical protein
MLKASCLLFSTVLDWNRIPPERHPSLGPALFPTITAKLNNPHRERNAAKQEKVCPPSFAEIAECRQKIIRRISVSSASLGGK